MKATIFDLLEAYAHAIEQSGHKEQAGKIRDTISVLHLEEKIREEENNRHNMKGMQDV